jgi:hypothetical protein
VRGDFRRDLQAHLGDIDDITCPTCHSFLVVPHASFAGLGVSILMWLWMGYVVPPPKTACRCQDCGARWAR